jgi:hypothetical protein
MSERLNARFATIYCWSKNGSGRLRVSRYCRQVQSKQRNRPRRRASRAASYPDEPPADRQGLQSFTPRRQTFRPAPFASESNEVRLGFTDLAPSYHHERAAVRARRVLAGIQRIEQEFLIARHMLPSYMPNVQNERLLLRASQATRKTRRRTGGPMIGGALSHCILWLTVKAISAACSTAKRSISAST